MREEILVDSRRAICNKVVASFQAKPASVRSELRCCFKAIPAIQFKMARIKRRLRRSNPKMKRKITTCSSCSKRATSSKPKVERGQLTYLLTNPGLDHIPRQVLGYLDTPTIVSCLRVSKAFKAMIENERHWYLLQSKLLRKYRTPNMIMTASATGQLRQLWTKTALLFNRRLVPPKYPQWVKAFEFYENEANFEELQGFVRIYIH